MFSKDSIRHSLLEKRLGLDESQVTADSGAIVNKIISMPDYEEASTILAYYPVKNEVDIRPLILDALDKGKRVGLPVTFDNRIIRFYEIWDLETLNKGKFNIPEPTLDIEITSTDCMMIIPGVGYDIRKYRLGYGGGYYDVFLEDKEDMYVIAPAYDFQIVDSFSAEEYDKAVDVIITPEQMII